MRHHELNHTQNFDFEPGEVRTLEKAKRRIAEQRPEIKRKAANMAARIRLMAESKLREQEAATRREKP